MLAWLESSGHWGFIGASLVAAFILVLIDLLPPLIKQRQLLRDIRAQQRRAQSRGSHDAAP
jgi:heme exporter protein CcmD